MKDPSIDILQPSASADSALLGRFPYIQPEESRDGEELVNNAIHESMHQEGRAVQSELGAFEQDAIKERFGDRGVVVLDRDDCAVDQEDGDLSSNTP